MFGRPAAMAASIGLSLLFLSAGWATLPTRNPPPTWVYRLPDPGSVAAADAIPVFIMRADRSTLRAGQANVKADGRIDVTLYDPSDPRLIDGSEGLLFNADLRVLWLMASEEERAQLQRGLEKLGRGLREAVDAVLRSPEFNEDYRSALTEIGRETIEAAWRDPRTRAAYEELLRSAEPVLREAVGRDLKAIVLKRAEPLLWEMVSANVGSLFSVFHAHQWDLTPVEQAMDAIQRDVRERALIEKTAQRILDSWQAKDFLRTFAGNVVDAVARDTRLKDVLARLLTDQRLGPYLSAASQPAGELARMTPQVLFGVHPQSDLNALAAYTFRGFVTGRPGPLIILMNAQRREEILALDRQSPRPLLHGTAQ
ncbi:hypothetical protein TSO221_13155 [Azospirillum sp. TSO22-1]|nr:hypothetical protein TSO221_13155 [Azospirillum sp. TSO22-1]